MKNGVLGNTPGHEEMLRGLLLALCLDMDMDQQVHQLNKLAMMLARMLLEALHMYLDMQGKPLNLFLQ